MRKRMIGLVVLGLAALTAGLASANGLNDMHWLKVLVDADSRDVFAYQPQIVPANRVAVPAP